MVFTTTPIFLSFISFIENKRSKETRKRPQSDNAFFPFSRTFSFVLPIRPARRFLVRPCFTMVDYLFRKNLSMKKAAGAGEKKKKKNIGWLLVCMRTAEGRDGKRIDGQTERQTDRRTDDCHGKAVAVVLTTRHSTNCKRVRYEIGLPSN